MQCAIMKFAFVYYVTYLYYIYMSDICNLRSFVFPDFDSPIARTAGENIRVVFVENYSIYWHGVRLVICPHVDTTIRCIAFIYGTFFCAYQEDIVIGGMKRDARSAS